MQLSTREARSLCADEKVNEPLDAENESNGEGQTTKNHEKPKRLVCHKDPKNSDDRPPNIRNNARYQARWSQILVRTHINREHGNILLPCLNYCFQRVSVFAEYIQLNCRFTRKRTKTARCIRDSTAASDSHYPAA